MPPFSARTEVQCQLCEAEHVEVPGEGIAHSDWSSLPGLGDGELQGKQLYPSSPQGRLTARERKCSEVSAIFGRDLRLHTSEFIKNWVFLFYVFRSSPCFN